MSAKRTLYICKAICWNCKKEFKAAYGKWERKEKQCVVSPGNFSEKEKAVAVENGVVIKTIFYPNDDFYTVNICPHCGKPYSNNRIGELVGHEEKEIVMLNQISKRMFLNKQFEYAGTIGKLDSDRGNFKGIYIIVRPEKMQDILLNQTSNAGKYKGKDPTVNIEKLKQKLLVQADILYLGKSEGSVEKRMQQHIEFWNGKPISAWGGRSIAQIQHFEDLEVWYLPCDNPKEMESALLNDFETKYNQLPFANWRH